MPSPKTVFDVFEADFQTAVVERSRSVPVVVDFWAQWCGPCRALGPLLEKLAAEAGGAWALAKVNVDENQELAAAFRVSGIPAVFAICDAKVVGQFAGLMPEDELRRFIESILPSEADTLVASAAAAEVNDPATAERLYREALAATPAHEEARVGLARVLLNTDGREAEATELLRTVEVGDYAAEADRLRRVVALREVPHADADLTAAQAATDADPESAAAWLRVGTVLAARGAYTEALVALLAAAERDKALAGGEVRERMVAIFQVIGVRSTEADEYRDKLRALLY